MADKERDRKPQHQDDDVVGKAYDSRLMGRLLTYLRPYKLQATISLAAILLKAGSDVLGPYLTKIAVDRYMTARPSPHPALLTRWLSPNAMVGITQIASIYLGTLVLSYMLEFVPVSYTHLRHSQESSKDFVGKKHPAPGKTEYAILTGEQFKLAQLADHGQEDLNTARAKLLGQCLPLDSLTQAQAQEPGLFQLLRWAERMHIFLSLIHISPSRPMASI